VEEACEALERGEVVLRPVFRESDDGKPTLIAEGDARQVPMALEAKGGESQGWTERRLVVRSLRQAQASEAALRARVAKAKAQVEALNQRGRGRKRFEEIDELRQAVNEVVQRHQVETFYGYATITTARRAHYEHTGGVRRRAKSNAKPRLKCGGTMPRLTPRLVGWVGGCMAPINQVNSGRLHKPCWLPAVHIWWREVWAGLKDARCRSNLCMCIA
jgi:hypothetical protein